MNTATSRMADYRSLGCFRLESLADGHDLPMPKDHLVRVIHALIEGLVLQRMLTPELFPERHEKERTS
jgi:hypothetical protein